MPYILPQTATDREILTKFRGTRERIIYRLDEIDADIRKAEDILDPPPLLPCPAPPVTAVKHLPVPHRPQPPRLRHTHRTDGQHGAGGDVGEQGAPIPVRGCLSVADAHTRVQIPRGDSYSTGYRNIVVPDVQPLTGLWGCRIANGYRQGTPDGVRGAVGNVLESQRWKP